MHTGHKKITVIDFRPGEARVLELLREEENWKIIRTDKASIEHTDINVMDLKNLLSDTHGAKLSGRAQKILILLPSHLATTKVIDLPPVSLEIMHQAVEFAVREEYQSDDLKWDSSVSQNGNAYAAFVMAMRESEFTRYEKAFEGISRRIEVASTAACCGINLFKEKNLPESPDSVVIIDADPHYTTLTIANRRELLFSRTIKKGFEDPGSAWLIEVNSSINYFKSQQPENNIKEIYVLGTGLNNPDIINNLKSKIGLDVFKVDLDGSLKNYGIQAGNKLEPEYSSALGCALGYIKPVFPQLNLIPHRATAPILEALDLLWSNSAKFVMTACGIAVLVIIGLILSKFWIADMQTKRLESHQQVLEAIERMKVEQKGLQEVLKERTGWAEFYLFLAEKVDKNITFTHITLDKKEGVRIEGTAKSPDQVGTLIKTLNSSPYVKEVRLAQTSSNSGKLTFTLNGNLKR